MYVFLPKITSPIMIAAKPTTIIPRPLVTFALPLFWANNAPASAIKPLLNINPKIVILFVLIPCAFDIVLLSPVDLIAIPSSVPKNQYIIK